MPDTLGNIVGAWSGADFSSVATDNLVPFGLLKVPYSAREEASGNKVEDTSRDDEEDLKSGADTTTVKRM